MVRTRHDILGKISARKFEKEKERVMRKLRMLRHFTDNSEKAKAERREACRTDFWKFCKTYLPHYFTLKTQADWHQQYAETFKVPEQFTVIAAPRGNAKSTVGSFADPIHDICYQLEEFIVIAMSSLPKATMQTYRILLELQHNPLIVNDFGDLVSKNAAMDDFQTLTSADRTTSIRVAALGAGMDARGLVNMQYRPSKWINDDLETKSKARNPIQVEKLLDTVLSDYLPAMKNKGWKFRYVGTIQAKGSVLDKLMKNEELVRMKFKQIERDANGNEYSTWAEHTSLEAAKRMRRIMGPSKYDAEYQNDPRDNEGLIHDDWIVHWKNLPAKIDKTKLLIQIDPAYTKTGDNRAMYVVLAFNHTAKGPDFGTWLKSTGDPFEEGAYDIVIACYNRKASTTQFFIDLYDLYSRYKPPYVWVEGVFAQREFFMNEYRRFTLNEKYGKLPLKFYTPPKVAKIDRIRELESPIEQGLLVFPPYKGEDKDLEATLIQLTRHGEKDIPNDGPDCLAAALHVLHSKEKNKRKTYTGGR